MAIVKCKECGQPVSTKATACPHCGAKRAARTSGCVWIVAAFGGLFLLSIFQTVANMPSHSSTTGEPSAFDKRVTRALACDAANEAVRHQLLTPGAAKFPDCTFSADQYDIRVTPDGKKMFVMGYVDSQNSFGALLRKKYVAELAVTPDSPHPHFRAGKVTLE